MNYSYMLCLQSHFPTHFLSFQSQLMFLLFSEPVSGIPYFWLTIFKNVDMLAEMVQEHDEPIIKSLQDIKLKLTEEPMVLTHIVYKVEKCRFCCGGLGRTIFSLLLSYASRHRYTLTYINRWSAVKNSFIHSYAS